MGGVRRCKRQREDGVFYEKADGHGDKKRKAGHTNAETKETGGPKAAADNQEAFESTEDAGSRYGVVR